MPQTDPVKTVRPHGIGDTGITTRRLAVYVGISVMAHALFLLACLWLVQFRMPYPVQEVVHVDLVSFFPGEPGGATTLESAGSPVTPSPDLKTPDAETAVSVSAVPAEPSAPEEPDPVRVLKPDVSLRSKPENLEELLAKKAEPASEPKPKPEAKPETKPKPAQPAPEKKPGPVPEKKKPDSEHQLAEAMKRLAKEVEEQNRASAASGTGTGPVTGSGDGAGTGRKGGTPLDFYKVVLQSSIQQNWVFNEMLAGLDQNLEVRILIKILKNGEIRDIIYETRSGNPYLDQSAKRAIQRANPLPSLPPGMTSYDVVVIFTPKGLR